MSEDILNDDQLDAVAGGIIITATKVATNTYATTVRADRIAPPPAPKTHVLDRNASTAALGGLRARP